MIFSSNAKSSLLSPLVRPFTARPVYALITITQENAEQAYYLLFANGETTSTFRVSALWAQPAAQPLKGDVAAIHTEETESTTTTTEVIDDLDDETVPTEE